MPYAEKRNNYWRGRYRLATGELRIVKDAAGQPIRFQGKREAERAAYDAEAKARAGGLRDPSLSRMAFGDYASRWYAVQDLAASTMQNYRRHIEEHLLPAFEGMAVADILPSDVAAWEKRERAAGYAESSIKTWRATLHLILADAVDEGLRDANPATRRRGRGRRAGRSRHRGPEKAVTTALGILLIAERTALLSGRDDEFVAIVLDGYTGMRWGELIGLETSYVRSGAVRVEWQLYELDTGELRRCPPKDDSHRTIDTSDWLTQLLADHLARTQPKPCECHGLTYTFSGHGAVTGASRNSGVKLADVARQAGVSVGTVSTAMNRPASVPEDTLAKVQQAAATLGYTSTANTPAKRASHWRRNGFATWLFHPAAAGWYPPKAPQPARPVLVSAESWPGAPVRGRNAAERASACWVPIAPGMTPHGLRHTHRTLMEELGTPAKLMDERMGHADGSIQARYTHVTPGMRAQLLDGLTGLWVAALDARRALAPRSPVKVLDRLLTAKQPEVGQ